MSMPASIERTPGLDRWIRIADNGAVIVSTGKVEIGQGIKTAIAMIAAEELDVSVERIQVQTADTEITPNEYVTAGSMSVEDSGSAVRVASAAARQILLESAAEKLHVAVDTLTVQDGLITSGQSNEQTDYWSLQAGRLFEVDIIDVPPLKDPRSYRVVGTHTTRTDLAAKVRGDLAFVQDLRLADTWHGRLVKPPLADATLIECPDSIDLPDVEIVRDGNFVGVVAKLEAVAIAAAERLASKARWQSKPLEPPMPGIPGYLRTHVSKSLPVVSGMPLDETLPEQATPDHAVQTLNAAYYRPYQMHASLGPSAACAQFVDGKLTVYSHSQGVELLKRALAPVLDLPVDRVHVIHREGAGCYGHNGADDVALDAALLAIALPPRPVMVKWSRADEHGFEPYAPATVIDMQASLDAHGRIIDWCHDTYSFSHNGRPRPNPGHTNLQSAWWREKPLPPVPRQPAMLAEAGIHRNLEPIYTLPRKRLVKHFVANSPLRTSSLRSLGAFANVFAIESFMDELAHAAGKDPFEFRSEHLADRRARAVLELLQQRAPGLSGDSNAGRGIAMARYKNRQTYCAVMVDVHVEDDGQVRLDHAVISADAGLVIDPDGLINQLEGGFIQAASWTLKEQVTWDHEGVTSRDWESYPILTFSEIPTIATYLIDRRLDQPMGAGEASTGPTPAAIANAIFAAVGVRVRDLPFTPERVKLAAGMELPNGTRWEQK